MKAKKAYIIPTVTTIKIRPVTMLASSGERGISEEAASSYSEQGGIAGDDNGDVYGRKVIQTPDAWGEW